MSKIKTKRKLIAILSADVVGYSRLMGENEEHTVQTLNSYRELMCILIDKHNGDLVDAVGDNLLAQFTSIVDAVRCAVEIQSKLKKQNENLSKMRRMFFRIGINIGDVIQEKEKIYGDGVNIAARIESLANPGGICISRGVYDHIKKKLNFGYEYIGEHLVKNISDQIRVYKVLTSPEDSGKRINTTSLGKLKIRLKTFVRITVLLIFIISAVLGGLYWKYLYLPGPKNIDPDNKLTFDLPDGPSIAVLAFDNMSGDPEQEYFCDGITDNIISALSYVRGLLVVARNSSFSYKGRSVKVQEIGRELGVKYIVEGSVQKNDQNIRVIVQLIDAKTGHHIWSEIYDRPLKNIFTIQDEIAIQLCEVMQIKTTEGETFRNRFKGIDNVKHGMKLLKIVEDIRYANNREAVISAKKNLEEIIRSNPKAHSPYLLLSMSNLLAIELGVCENPIICFGKATEATRIALSLDYNNSDAHMAAAYLFLLRKEHDSAIKEFKMAISLNPNNADAYSTFGYALTLYGQPEEGVHYIEKALAIAPIPPVLYLFHLGIAYYETEQYDKVIKVLQKALEKNNNHRGVHLRMSAAYVQLGDLKAAEKSAREVLRVDPKFNLNGWITKLPYKNTKKVDQYIKTLAIAGLPMQ